MTTAQHKDDGLPSIHANEVNGIDCPACGHPTLMLMSGGYITCALLECPNPDYAEANQALIATAVQEARNQEAKDIFYLLWDEDGSPFQYRDPPYEMLEHLKALQANRDEL